MHRYQRSVSTETVHEEIASPRSGDIEFWPKTGQRGAAASSLARRAWRVAPPAGLRGYRRDRETAALTVVIRYTERAAGGGGRPGWCERDVVGFCRRGGAV